MAVMRKDQMPGSRTRTVLRTALTGAILLTGSLLGPAQPAVAGTGAQDPWGSDTPWIQYQGAEKVGGCTVYASSSGYGSICKRSGSSGESLLKLLKEKHLPECWHERPVHMGEEALPGEHEGQQGEYWLETCIKGIDLNAPSPDLSKLFFEYSVVWIPAGQSPILLTEDQEALRDLLDSQNSGYPRVTTMTSPVLIPRVGQNIAFHLIDLDKEGAPVDEGPRCLRGTVPVCATLMGIRVHPGTDAGTDAGTGTGERPKDPACTGGGTPIVPGERVEGRNDVCSWQYERSSAGQGDDSKYKVTTELRWDVSYEVGGESVKLGSFKQEVPTKLSVTEVQTLVVPRQAAR